MSNNKFIFISISAILLGLILSVSLYKKVNPLNSIKLSFDKKEIIQISQKFLSDNNILSEDGQFYCRFRTNDKLLNLLHNKIGIEKTNEHSTQKYPIYYWRVVYSEQISSTENISVVLTVDTKGRIISFNHKLPKDVIADEKNPEEIKQLSDKIIGEKTFFSNAVFTSIKINNSDYINAQDGKFWKDKVRNGEIEVEYKFEDENFENPVIVSFLFEKGRLTKIKSDLPVGSNEVPENNSLIINIVIKLIIGIVVVIIALIALFQRIKSGEIGFRISIFIAILTLFSTIFATYGTSNNPTVSLKLINSIFSAVILSGVALVLWTLTEALIREKWTDKLNAFDLIIHRQFGHSLIGRNVLGGIAFGILFTGLEYLIMYLFLNVESFSFSSFTNGLNYIFSDFPLVRLTSSSFLVTLGYTVPFLGLIPALIGKKINNNLAIVIVSAVIFGVFRFTPEFDLLGNVTIYILISALYVYLFIKFDFLTVFISLFVNLNFTNIITFYEMENISFLNIGMAFGYVLVFFIIYSVIVIYSKDKIKNVSILAPHYAKALSERERLIEEINSARDVQNSFLPKEMPSFKGVDVAASCKPAIEVGGDYYDFHKISDTEFSFVIGDVSGKGTKAAFIMTIIKGFLKALLRSEKSLKELIVELNKLFIDNVPKGNFVTLLMGSVNTVEKTFRFCSAGHNPLILKKKNGDLQELNPEGMAIGLTNNSIFENTLKEVTVNYEPGDMIITYTDGFTETLNRKKEEFGVDKFKHIVKIFDGISSEELINLLIRHTNRFRGMAKQHDDMTIIIINFEE